MDEIIIDKDSILVNDTAHNSEEIIRKLGGMLFKKQYVKESYIQAVLEREKVFPTGLQTMTIGFAIPHADSQHVLQSTVAVATLTTPIIFKAMDNPDVDIPVSMVMMLAIDDPDKVVETLTKIISIVEDEGTLSQIMDATTKQEIQQAVSDHLKKITQQRSADKFDIAIGH